MKRLLPLALLVSAGLIAAAIAQTTTPPPGGAAGARPAAALPPGEPQAMERLNTSPRHGEWVELTVPGAEKKMRAYVVHPERADKAPVVLVIMEIFGMSDWIRSVTDQLAADGFIAIAPDFLSNKGPGGGPIPPDQARGAVGQLRDPDVLAGLNAARDYGIKLPNATTKTATIGFCWGGGKSFLYAANQPDLNAAVVFYGPPPADDLLAKIKAPVAGFYGGNDARITATVEPTTAKMKNLNKTYETHVYEGAGHGFLRQQAAPPANMKATQEAWPAVLKFLRDNTK
jgi:carboxymethylenebutenolidase